MASDCIAVRVRIINRVVTALYDEAFRPHGLRVSQANILVAVARMGGARPADICRRLRLEKSTLSRDVEIMKATAGWSRTRRPGPESGAPAHPGRPGPPRPFRPAWESAQAQARRLIGDPGVDALEEIAGAARPRDNRPLKVACPRRAANMRCLVVYTMEGEPW